MHLKDMLDKLPTTSHGAMRVLWIGLENVEHLNVPANGYDYIQLLSLVQCEIANRIHTAAEELRGMV